MTGPNFSEAKRATANRCSEKKRTRVLKAEVRSAAHVHVAAQVAPAYAESLLEMNGSGSHRPVSISRELFIRNSSPFYPALLVL
jgi:hypothetical protein